MDQQEAGSENVGRTVQAGADGAPDAKLRLAEATVVIGEEAVNPTLSGCNLHVHEGGNYALVYAFVALQNHPYRGGLGIDTGDAVSAYRRLRNCLSGYGPYGDTTYFNGRREPIAMPIVVVN